MKKSLLAVIALVVALMLVVVPAMAHESREVGNYVIVFGWWAEPAVVDEANGPEIAVYVRNPDATRGDLVAGAELYAEVIYGDESITVELAPVWGNDGHYRADVFPTMVGDYTFHITGLIGDVEVDETFTSADGGFSSVQPLVDFQFPVANPSNAELVQMILELQAQIAELQAQVAALSE